MKEPRITTLTIGPMSEPIDVDEDWDKFKNSSFQEKLESIIEDTFWMIHLPWLDQSLEIRNSFWEKYSARKPAELRFKAVHGLLFANNLSSLRLLNDAIQFERDRVAGKFKGHHEHFEHACISVGLRFAQIAVQKDHKLLRQLADVMEAGGIDGGEKGGEESFNGQVIREFCQIVSEHRKLPTKKQMREGLNLSTFKSETEKLRIAMNELGLSGLPRG